MYADGAEQLGGGGRYDDLAAILGARQPLPAVGFSLGLERVIDAVHRTDQGTALLPPTVVVAQGDAGNEVHAVRVAQLLRAEGWTALLDVRERKTNAALKHARTLRADVYAEPTGDGTTLRWVPLNGTPEKHISLASDNLPRPPSSSEQPPTTAARVNGALHDE